MKREGPHFKRRLRRNEAQEVIDALARARMNPPAEGGDHRVGEALILPAGLSEENAAKEVQRRAESGWRTPMKGETAGDLAKTAEYPTVPKMTQKVKDALRRAVQSARDLERGVSGIRTPSDIDQSGFPEIKLKTETRSTGSTANFE